MGHYIALSLLAVLGLGMIFIFYLTVKGKAIERRLVFLYIAFTVLLPLFVKIKPPIQVSPEVQQVVETITTRRLHQNFSRCSLHLPSMH
jgi:hypothetical protein